MALDETLWTTMRSMQDGIGAINDYLRTTENEAEQQHYGLLRTCLQEAAAIIAADNGLTFPTDTSIDGRLLFTATIANDTATILHDTATVEKTKVTKDRLNGIADSLDQTVHAINDMSF